MTAEDNSGAGLGRRDKDAPGRGAAIIIYGLYLGAIMTVVTLPVGALLAHYKLGRGAAWVDSHLRFQILTFWLLLLASAGAVVIWQLLGQLAVPPLTAGTFGYLYVTAAVAWYIGRCGVGIHRLTGNEPIARPYSPLFG